MTSHFIIKNACTCTRAHYKVQTHTFHKPTHTHKRVQVQEQKNQITNQEERAGCRNAREPLAKLIVTCRRCLFPAFAGLAMGFLKLLNGLQPTAAASQLLEWVLVGFIPISGVVGAYFTQIARLSIFHNINRLRADFVKEQQLMDMAKGGDKESQGGGSTSGSQVSIANAIPKTRTPYERFYKSLPTGSNAFHSALHALVNIRQLTFERQEKDIPFLEYLIGRALKEFPASVDLQMLQVM